MPNYKDLHHERNLRLMEAMEHDPSIKAIFDRRMNPEKCNLFGESNSTDNDSGIRAVAYFPSPIVKLKVPSFLKDEQKEFFINRFPLKGKNE